MEEKSAAARVALAGMTPAADEARAAIVNAIKAWAEIVRIITDFVATIERLAPAIRKAHRHLSLAAHRRRQDWRRRVAKAGRRERTGRR